jgi:hypothetical protein
VALLLLASDAGAQRVAPAASQTFSTAQSPFPRDPLSGGPDVDLNQGSYAFNYFYGPTQRRGWYDVWVYRIGARNYFSFDLRSACRAANVSLRIVRGDGPAGPPEPSEDLFVTDRFGRYTIYDVTTPAEVVNVPSGGDPLAEDWFDNAFRVFNDLGSGTQYHSAVWPFDGSPSDVLTFPLNASAVSDFNAARGGFFTIGGSGGGPEYSYGSPFPNRDSIFAGVTDPAQLVVTCALPTTKEECKNGGWREFGTFANQGGCVSYVASRRPPS